MLLTNGDSYVMLLTPSYVSDSFICYWLTVTHMLLTSSYVSDSFICHWLTVTHMLCYWLYIDNGDPYIIDGGPCVIDYGLTATHMLLTNGDPYQMIYKEHLIKYITRQWEVAQMPYECRILERITDEGVHNITYEGVHNMWVAANKPNISAKNPCMYCTTNK